MHTCTHAHTHIHIHSMVLLQDGSVWATGSNKHGQLGIGSRADRDNFVQVLVGGAKTITAGGRHSMVQGVTTAHLIGRSVHMWTSYACMFTREHHMHAIRSHVFFACDHIRYCIWSLCYFTSEHHIRTSYTNTRQIICEITCEHHIQTSYTNTQQIICEHHMWTWYKLWMCLYVMFICECHTLTSNTESVPAVCDVHMWTARVNITYIKWTDRMPRMCCSYVNFTCEHDINWDARSHVNHTC